MKIRRQKTVKRLVAFYRNNFQIKPPYQVLIDGTFCRAALKFKINIGEQLPKYLAGEVELVTTVCAIRECELLGTLLYGPLKLLRQYRLVSCKHAKCPVSAAECLLSLARKSDSHYMFATQDKKLSEKLRAMPGRPLLYMAYNAIHLETPASASHLLADATTAAKLEVNERQQEALVHAAKAIKPEKVDELMAALPVVKKEEQEGTWKKPRKRRGPKGPNPLSCKKSKKDKQDEKAKKNKKRRNRKQKVVEAAV